MDYNWKYAAVRSTTAFRVWQSWNAQSKIEFLFQCKDDFSNKMRLFACWSIEEIIGKHNLENDYNSSLYIAKKVARGKMKMHKLLAAKGRYRTPDDYDNMESNRKADMRLGPDQKNINWLRVMNKLCNVDAYGTTAAIIWLLEEYRVQERFNHLIADDKTYEMMQPVITSNHWEIEAIYNAELERGFNYIFDEKEIEIFIKPNQICYDLGVAPFIKVYPGTWSRVEKWNYGVWAFCVDNGIIV